MTHQEALLRLALMERCVREPATVDHLNGSATVGDVTVGIVYPDSFFRLTLPMFERTARPLAYAFRGYVTRQGGRPDMLAPWLDRADSAISESLWAHDTDNKGRFDADYFDELSSARFGLCPNHVHWSGPPETAWSYRFVDCCLVGALPVLFRAAPLSESFTHGFRFAWDDEPHVYERADAEHNRRMAVERFAL